MSDRIARINLGTGELEIIALQTAVSELSGSEIYGTIVPRLVGGEALKVRGGFSYRALSALGAVAIYQLPPQVVS